MGFHHVAYTTRDCEATRHFYEDLMGFPLIYTEVQGKDPTYVRHIFFDIGDGECLAFFEVANVGEAPDYKTDITTSVGLPVWTNHAAFSATAEQQSEVKARMTAAGIEPLMDIDHGWCHSLYYVDPNGVMVELCRNTPGFEADTAEAHRLAAGNPLELIGDAGVAGRH